MKYDDLVGELYLVASNVQSERRKNMLVQAADAIQELTVALTASNEVIATQSSPPMRTQGLNLMSVRITGSLRMKQLAKMSPLNES